MRRYPSSSNQRDALKIIKDQRKDLFYLIEGCGERIVEKCADNDTENLLEYIERNAEYVQFLRLQIEEAFICLLLNA